MKIVKSRTPSEVKVNFATMPQYQIDAMCKTVIECVNRFFENPEVMADYKRWKQERQQHTEKDADSRSCL